MKLKTFDRKYYNKKISIIAGVDEAGRGPLAGPVVAAAVIFDKNTNIKEVNDSKKLSPKKREQLFNVINQKALSIGVGIVDCKEIERINILQASLKAMQIAVSQLKPKPEFILIDGNKIFQSDISVKCIIKGDSKSFSIAAASIIAKVTRDRIMQQAAEKYPVFHWEKNKGYGTKQHREAIVKFGYTKLHRQTFLRKLGTEFKLFAYSGE